MNLEQRVAGTMSAQDVLEKLKSSTAGLSASEAASRLAQYGPNELARERNTAARILLSQFRSALIYFLVVAAALSFATGDVSDGAIIAAILLINAALGFSQEYHSAQAIEKLSKFISHDALVLRDGKPVPVAVSQLVPGDLVTVKEGDVVPADLKLLRTEDLELDESQLTGESMPVPKSAEGANAQGSSSLAFTGSTVVRGEGTGVCYATAAGTELGKVATLSTSVQRVTQYERSMRDFSLLLVKIIVASLAVTLAIKLALAKGSTPVVQLLVFVIVLAVAVVPEALPVISTLTLARGAVKLAREKVVVKRLSSLEDLGNVTLLCTDKTGTLTENKLTVQHLASSDDHLFQVLAFAAIDPGGSGTQASFDTAFAAWVPDAVKLEAAGFAVTGEVPFDPADRRRRILLTEKATGSRWLVVVGSPETLLDMAHCPDAARYHDVIVQEGHQGLRHLGLAYRKLAPASATETTDILAEERDLIFLGFVSLADPLRPSTPQTIELAKQLGVTVKILTGDSPEVAGYVAGQIDLIPAGAKVYSGDELAQMTTAQFAQTVDECNVFARVSPEQKFSIVQALKAHQVVGYQGDGINDAPALKLADVGIAVDSATEVAKASADIILLDKDLGVIVNAIKYGRTTFTNINKYVKYTMVGNFGNFFALAILYLLAASLPLLPRQILLISLLTDLPLVAISTDNVDTHELERPDRYDAGTLLRLSLVLGTLTALFELAFFAGLHGESLVARQTDFYLFLSLTQLIVIVSIRNRGHFWRATRPSALLTEAILLTASIVVAMPYIPPLARLFSFHAISLGNLGLVLAVVALYLLALDALKVRYYSIAARLEAGGKPRRRLPRHRVALPGVEDAKPSPGGAAAPS